MKESKHVDFEMTFEEIISAFEQVAGAYHTTVFELLYCYLYYLVEGNRPVGIPKTIIKESEAEDWHYANPNYLVVEDSIDIKFPEVTNDF